MNTKAAAVVLSALMILAYSYCTAQAPCRVYKGERTGERAKLVVLADTVRGVYYWNAEVYSDHDGEKEVETAQLLSRDKALHVYELNEMHKPGARYGVLTVLRDTFVRDTIFVEGKAPAQKLPAKIQWKGSSYKKSVIQKLLAYRKEEQ